MKNKTKIHVFSKLKFVDTLKKNAITDENVHDFHREVAFISINDSSGDFYHKPVLNDAYNVLVMFFDDVSGDDEFSLTNVQTSVPFTERDAKRVISFLENNRGVKTLIVHCAAGVSRSGAVGEFALGYLDGDREHFYRTNTWIMPNSHVSHLLEKTARNA